MRRREGDGEFRPTTIRLRAETFQALDKWAWEHHTSLSDACDKLVYAAIQSGVSVAADGA